MYEEFARQARQFGYQVSPLKAIDTPAARAYTDELYHAADRQIRGVRLWSLPIAGLLATGDLVLFVVVLGALPVWGFPILAVSGGALIVALAALTSPGPENFVKPARELLSAQPWQVWPARLEDLSREDREAVAGAGVSTVHHPTAQVRRDARLHRLVLLAPDGTAVRTYGVHLPRDARDGFVDGIGAVWVCGDLRDAILVAEPGARRYWQAKPVAFPTRPHSQEDPGTVDAVATEAGRVALQVWLG
ncbi:hypothetical protein [Embleya sp. NPDC020630]|uniref:hypothetical protein n=1 Tax=Embleya sp. NPDC020630 TaxID=3363979 RepID=UPI00379D91F1